MRKNIKILLLTMVITLLLAGGVYCGLYYGGVIDFNSTSADSIIDRTAEDIEEINLKIDNIETTMQIIQSNQSLTAEEVAKIKVNMQEQIDTLKTYQTLLKALQDEVKILKDLQESTASSIQSDLQGFVQRLEHIEAVVDSITETEPLTTKTHTLTTEEQSSVIESGEITCKRYGNVVTLYITHVKLNVDVAQHTSVTIAQIPEEYRSSVHISHAYVSMITGSHFVEVSIEGDLILSAWANKITIEDFHAVCLTYVV